MTTTREQKQVDSTRPEKTKLDKTHQWVTVVSGSIGALGALGTLTVWLAANFYTGEVVLTPGTGKLVTIKVTTPKGDQATYYARRFQLMPGQYHFEVTEDGGTTKHFDNEVVYQKTTSLNVEAPTPSTEPDQDSGDTAAKKKWWQLWKRNAAEKKSDAAAADQEQAQKQ